MIKKITIFLSLAIIVALLLGTAPTQAVIPADVITSNEVVYSLDRDRWGDSPGGRGEFYKAPHYTLDASGNYVSYVFTGYDDHYQVQAAGASVRFFDYYTEVWDEDFGSVIIYDDRWTVDYLNKQGKWRDAGFWNTVRSYEIIEDGIRLIRTGDTTIGQRKEIYTFKAGEACKIEIEQTCNDAQTIRFVWKPSGIVADYENAEFTVEEPEKQRGLAYYTAEGDFVARIQWFDELELTDTITCVVGTSAQGRKATVTFGDFSASVGETVVLDPKFEYYTTGPNTVNYTYGVNWFAQTFTPSAPHTITSVKILIYRVGSGDPGDLSVGIRATSGGEPTGADLCSGSIAGSGVTTDIAADWYEITLGAGTDLASSTMYAMVVDVRNGDASDYIRWLSDNSSPTYSGGTYCDSTDSGVNWSTDSGIDFMFEEWGTVIPPEVTTNAASVVEETTASLSGNVTAIKDTNITDRGFVWDTSTHGDPGNVAPGASGYANNWTEAGSFGMGVYTHGITGLTKGELYYVRACVQNDVNIWAYGAEVTFLTKPDEPNTFVAVASADGVITLTWVKGTGAQKTYIRGEAGSYPTDRADGYEVYDDTGTTDTDTGLTGGTTYYYRAWSYATEGALEQYSDLYDQDNAVAIETPTLTTSTVVDLEDTTVTLGGNITVLGDGNSTDRGFVWATSSQGDPGNSAPGASGYANNWTEAGSFGMGAFTHGLTSLTSGQDYYYRSCAQNSMGWDYGAEVNFQTLGQVLWFEPTTIISGTTLPDRSAEGNDGTITWGTNPVGLAVTMGGFVSESQPTPSIMGGDETVEDIAPAITQPSNYLTGRDMSSNPFYVVVKPLADLTGFNESWIWVVFATIIVFIVMVMALVAFHSQLIAGIAGFAFIALFYQMGIYPFWILIVYTMIAVAIVVFEKVQTV